MSLPSADQCPWCRNRLHPDQQSGCHAPDCPYEASEAKAALIDTARSVLVEDPACGGPPLMFASRNRLTNAALANLRDSIESGLSQTKPILLDSGIEVYQLLGERWERSTS